MTVKKRNSNVKFRELQITAASQNGQTYEFTFCNAIDFLGSTDANCSIIKNVATTGVQKLF